MAQRPSNRMRRRTLGAEPGAARNPVVREMEHRIQSRARPAVHKPAPEDERERGSFE